MEPLLEAERIQCNSVTNELDRVQERLVIHREQDEPRYAQWLQSHFAKEISEVRGLRERQSELEILVSEVEFEAMRYGCSEHEAYHRVLKNRERRERSGDSHESGKGRGKDAGDKIPPELEEMLREAFENLYGRKTSRNADEFEELFEEFKHQFEDDVFGNNRGSDGSSRGNEESREPSRKNRRTKPEPVEAEAKTLYRSLARILHPDANPNPSARQKELWLEAQQAYELKDVVRLRTLLDLAESDGPLGYEKVRSVARLKAILKDLVSKLRSVQKELKQAKRAPHWNFRKVQTDPKRMRKLSREIEDELETSACELRFTIEMMEHQIERWAESAPIRRRSSGRGSRRHHEWASEEDTEASW